jgi:hypothetical protein
VHLPLTVELTHFHLCHFLTHALASACRLLYLTLLEFLFRIENRRRIERTGTWGTGAVSNNERALILRASALRLLDKHIVATAACVCRYPICSINIVLSISMDSKQQRVYPIAMTVIHSDETISRDNKPGTLVCCNLAYCLAAICLMSYILLLVIYVTNHLVYLFDLQIELPGNSIWRDPVKLLCQFAQPVSSRNSGVRPMGLCSKHMIIGWMHGSPSM